MTVAGMQTAEEANVIAQRANVSTHTDAGGGHVQLTVPQGLERALLLIAVVDGPLHALALLRSFSHGR